MERTIDQFRYIYMKRAGFLNKSCGDIHQPTIKWADSLSELEQAFGLVHDEYLREGYLTEPTRSGIFFNVHNLLRNSATLVVKDEKKIVGTLSIVIDDTDLGLPLDSLYTEELKTLRGQGFKLCEFCSLAISNGYRNGRLIMPMIRKLILHAMSEKMDYICIMVNPKHVPFYKKIMLFRDLGPEKIYPRLAAPAVCLKLNLNTFKQRMAEAYSGFDSAENLYGYFFRDVEKEPRNFAPVVGIRNQNALAAFYFLNKEEHIRDLVISRGLLDIILQF